MNFESKKVEKIILSLLFGAIVMIPLYITEWLYIYIYYTFGLYVITKDEIVITYNGIQVLIIAFAYYKVSK